MSKISQALIMAAGYATRMRPLTDHLPKPLLKVGDLPLLTHIINHLLVEGVTKIIVNGYHAIDPLREYMDHISKQHPSCEFILSEEDELLETGGGAVQARQYLTENEPFYMINGDAFWVNGASVRTLQDLADKFDRRDCSLLLLLQSCSSMAMTEAVGDYNIDESGLAVRSKNKNGTYMFSGVRVCMPCVLDGYVAEKYSFLKNMDDQENQGKLCGLAHKGEWYHISTPADLDEVNDALFKRAV